MKASLLNQDGQTGNGNQPAPQPAADRPAASPPAAAETVANGKSEREAQLERENTRLKQAVKQTAASKRKVELDNIKLAATNQELKQIPQPKPQPNLEKPKCNGWFFN